MAAVISIEREERRVLVDGEQVALRAKSFDVLSVLASRPGHLFSRDVLIDLVWEGRMVSPDVVKGCIREIRGAIGDDALHPVMIETVPKHGYRLLRPIVPLAGCETHPADYWPAKNADAVAVPETASVAVLRLRAEGEDAQSDALALGRDIASGLARTRWLTVAAPSSSLRFVDDPGMLRQTALRLGVRYLLHGGLRRTGKRFRIDAALSDARSNSLVWATRLERSGPAILDLMDEICEEIVAVVEAEIESAERMRALLSPVRTLDAWSGFHRGMAMLQRYKPESFRAIHSTLRTAARSDPACARVAAARSYLFWQQLFMGTSKDRKADIARSRDLAAQAISLDPRDPLGYWARGRADIFGRDLASAVDSFGMAVQLNPSYAIAHYSLGHALKMLGRYEDAKPHIKAALRLSPLDDLAYAFYVADADLRYFSGDPEGACMQARRGAEHPNAHAYVQVVAAWVHELCGEHESALRYVERARRLSPGYNRKTHFSAFRSQAHPVEARREIEGAFDRLGL